VQTALTDIQGVAERNNLTVRAYQTAAGSCVPIANATFQAGDHRTEDLLQQFSADPLYLGRAACKNPFERA
jgi:hypothetical protein